MTPKLARQRTTSTVSANRSLALLSARQPDSTESILYSYHYRPRSKRLIQLRRGVLLIFKKRVRAAPAYSTDQIADIPHAERAIVLTRRLAVTRLGPTALQIGPKARIWFSCTYLRDHWLQLIERAQAGHDDRAKRYQVRRELAQRAAGAVYLARDRVDNNHYALKVVPKEETFFVESRLRSAVAERVALETAALLDSAFIVRLVDAFQTDENLVFVTELAAYGDLARLQTALPSHRLPEELARNVFAEMVMGLEETHRMGFLYRDMTLPNIMLNEMGHVRLADFGLAKRLAVEFEDTSVSSVSASFDDSDAADEDEPFRLVGRTKSFVGTRRYMSPEHLTAGSESERGYGAPADIWALGVCLYILLTGREPFSRSAHSRNSATLFNAIRREKIVYPSWLSEDAVSLLNGLLDRDSSARFDFAAIRSHSWLSLLNWNAVKQDSYNNVPNEDILALLRQAGIERVDSVKSEDDERFDGRSLTTLIGNLDRYEYPKQVEKKPSSYELVGFDFLNTSSERTSSERRRFSGEWSSIASTV